MREKAKTKHILTTSQQAYDKELTEFLDSEEERKCCIRSVSTGVVFMPPTGLHYWAIIIYYEESD